LVHRPVGPWPPRWSDRTTPHGNPRNRLARTEKVKVIRDQGVKPPKAFLKKYFKKIADSRRDC
jgi:hypothetical protein